MLLNIHNFLGFAGAQRERGNCARHGFRHRIYEIEPRQIEHRIGKRGFFGNNSEHGNVADLAEPLICPRSGAQRAVRYFNEPDVRILAHGGVNGNYFTERMRFSQKIVNILNFFCGDGGIERTVDKPLKFLFALQ